MEKKVVVVIFGQLLFGLIAIAIALSGPHDQILTQGNIFLSIKIWITELFAEIHYGREALFAME